MVFLLPHYLVVICFYVDICFNVYSPKVQASRMILAHTLATQEAKNWDSSLMKSSPYVMPLVLVLELTMNIVLESIMDKEQVNRAIKQLDLIGSVCAEAYEMGNGK